VFLAEFWHYGEGKLFSEAVCDKVADAEGSSWFPRVQLRPCVAHWALALTTAQLCRSPTGMQTKKDRPDTNADLLFFAYRRLFKKAFMKKHLPPMSPVMLEAAVAAEAKDRE
jgi:hypothetical protein